MSAEHRQLDPSGVVGPAYLQIIDLLGYPHPPARDAPELEAYTRYTGTTDYLVNHLSASIFGTVLALIVGSG